MTRITIRSTTSSANAVRIAVLACVFVLSVPAYADEVNFCIKIATTYVDANSSQDFFTSSSRTYRKNRGGYAWIRRGSSTIFIGNTGHAHEPRYKGCTGFLQVPPGLATYKIRVRPKGAIDGNIVEVHPYPGTQSTSYHDVTVTIPSNPTGSNVRNYISIDPGNGEFEIALAALWSIENDFGGVEDTETDFFVSGTGQGTTCGPASCASTTSSTTADIFISNVHTNHKFLIAHEFGHAFSRYIGAPASCYRSQNYSIQALPPCAGYPNHAPESQEFQTAANGEGWAHFFAADAWNDHDEDDCSFEYYNLPTTYTIDCESAATYPNAYHHTYCASPLAGKGVALDWLRTYWDLHTNTSGFLPLEDFKPWFDATLTCGDTTVFLRLDTASNDASVSSTFESHWDNAKCWNGINDPGTGGC